MGSLLSAAKERATLRSKLEVFARRESDVREALVSMTARCERLYVTHLANQEIIGEMRGQLQAQDRLVEHLRERIDLYEDELRAHRLVEHSLRRQVGRFVSTAKRAASARAGRQSSP